MNSNFKTLLFSAAVSGLLTGTAVYAHAATPAEGSQAPYASSSSAHLLYTSTTTDKHSCQGKNSCKGKGGCKTSDNGCKGKNSCKGKGGCATDISNAQMKKMMKKMHDKQQSQSTGTQPQS